MDLLNGAGDLVADALVILGVAVMTIGVFGIFRMPDLYTRLHATSKAVFLGIISLAAASIFTGQLEIILRVALLSVILILTTPIAAHVIAKAAYDEGERMRAPGAVDESGKRLPERGEDSIQPNIRPGRIAPTPPSPNS